MRAVLLAAVLLLAGAGAAQAQDWVAVVHSQTVVGGYDRESLRRSEHGVMVWTRWHLAAREEYYLAYMEYSCEPDPPRSRLLEGIVVLPSGNRPMRGENPGWVYINPGSLNMGMRETVCAVGERGI
jgi:hypothetical protein